jgi:hypothetical protein
MADKPKRDKKTIFSKLLEDLARRKKAQKKAGGNVGKEGKRVKADPYVKG